MKKMTERQAWLLCARAWSGRISKCQCTDSCRVFGPRINGSVCIGICGTLTKIPRLSIFLALKMKKKIPIPPGEAFGWPTTRKAAKQRVAFCRKMAKLCALALCLLLSGCGWTQAGHFDGDCGKVGKGGLLPPPREVRELVRPPERGEPGYAEYWSSQHYRGVDER